MERLVLAVSLLFFLAGFGYTLYAFGAGRFLPNRLNFILIAGGFFLQTLFLYERGRQIGRCPLTNLFEVLVFLSWALVLIYLVVGAAYRLSLMGAFTSPVASGLLLASLLLPLDRAASRPASPPDPWLEMHGALSVIAYGALALAAVAGVMYLVQQCQIKSRHPGSVSYHMPSIADLATANARLIFLGWTLLTAGLIAGFAVGMPEGAAKLWWSGAVWLLYGGMVLARRIRGLSPGRQARFSVAAFVLVLVSLLGVIYLP